MELPANYDYERLRKMARAGQHRTAVGAMWDVIGELTLNYLVEQGLRPAHTLLDVGCGALRAGVRLVDYLDTAHYFGVDAVAELLEAGYELELAAAGLTDKLPRDHLVADSRFRFDLLPETVPFDAAIAVSVFTHLPAGGESLADCLRNLAPRMRPKGVFHASFFICPDDHPQDRPLSHDPGEINSHSDRNPFHYSFRQVQAATDGTPWKVEPPDEWHHPRGQLMVRFVCTGG